MSWKSFLKKRRSLLLIILGFVVLIFTLWFIPQLFSKSTPSPSDTSSIPQGSITITGKMVCLPHKDTSGPQTMECAFGLRDGSGQYYALRDSSPLYQNIAGIPMDTPVTIEGNFTPQEDDKYQSIGVIEVIRVIGSREDWLTANDPNSAVTFQYPGQPSLNYIHTVDWPPQVSVTGQPFSCTEAGSENARAGRSEKVEIGDRTYCVTKVTEGAAGSIYTQYAYALPQNNKVVILTFSLRFVQCGNYDETEMKACEDERSRFNPNQLADSIMQTVQLN